MEVFTMGKRVMVLVTGLSTILGLTYFAIYGAALLRAEPQFELRFCGVDQQRPIIVGYSSYLVVGLSTEREDAPVVRSLSIESLGYEPLHFKQSDMFKL